MGPWKKQCAMEDRDGKIVEFECPLSQKMKEDVAREKDFKITDIEVRMTGY